MNTPLIVCLLVLVILFIMKLPVGITLLISSFSYLAVAGMDPSMAIETMVGKVFSNYTVFAVPLFLFAANLMNNGKITEKVFNFAMGFVGRFRGGLAHVNVLGSLVFSGMTGSAVADASGLGVMEIDYMKRGGYDVGFSAAITAASAVIGPIFPPSIPFVVYGMIAQVSIGNMFLAGMVPGVLLAIALCVYVAVVAKKRDYPLGEKYSLKQFLRMTLEGLPAILTPVILLGGIYSGVMTATEAGAVAAFYALLVSIFVYRSMDRKNFIQVLKDTIRGTGQVGILLAGAYAFSYIIALSGLPAIAGDFIGRVVSNKYSFLLLVNVVVFILGMLLDANVIQLLMLPILVPIAASYGIDLVHFGVLFTLNTMIGLCTPPFGTLLFIVTGISKEKMAVIIKEILPMIGVMVFVLLLITYVPDVIMWVPRLFGK